MADSYYTCIPGQGKECEEYHYTYIIWDDDTGEWYAGKHSTTDLSDGYFSSGVWATRHSRRAFLQREIVAFHPTELAAFADEILLIDLSDPLCMNRTEGGSGITSEGARLVWANPVFRQRKIDSLKRRGADPEHREKLRVLFATDEYRKKQGEAIRSAMATPEMRKKVSEAQKLRFQNPEERKRNSDSRLGTKHSTETRAKMSASRTGQTRSIESRAKMSAWQIGRKMSDEARAKMSAAAKARYSNPTELERLQKQSRTAAECRWGKRVMSSTDNTES